ncbi:hypothetical protein [Rhodococcus sp. KBW08]|nr:hypothetical protein [Rhodococcus sp. KBW08]
MDDNVESAESICGVPSGRTTRRCETARGAAMPPAASLLVGGGAL